MRENIQSLSGQYIQNSLNQRSNVELIHEKLKIIINNTDSPPSPWNV